MDKDLHEKLDAERQACLDVGVVTEKMRNLSKRVEILREEEQLELFSEEHHG